MNSLTLFTMSVLAVGPAVAQGRLWIVDQNNGVGTNFTDLPPAVAAAHDGDLIRVRAGTYTAASTSKALTIQRDHASAVPTLRGLTVQNLPAGRLLVLEGVALGFVLSADTSLTLNGCAGRVVLDRVELFSPGTDVIASCQHVQFNDCHVFGGRRATPVGVPPLQINDSHVAFANCRIEGVASDFLGVPSGSAALVATGSFVSLARSVVTGGGTPSFAGTNQPGLVLTDTNITVSGDGTSRVAAGTNPGGGGAAISAIVITRGGLTIDTAVVLQPTGGAPPIAINLANLTFTSLPSLKASGAPPGGIVTNDLFSPAGDVVLFLTGLPAGPLPVGLGEDLWLDPGLLIVLGVAVQGPGRHALLPTPIPNDPALAFGAWSQQALSGTFANGFRLSNPATYTLD